VLAGGHLVDGIGEVARVGVDVEVRDEGVWAAGEAHFKGAVVQLAAQSAIALF
jgi:hypothetical protein